MFSDYRDNGPALRYPVIFAFRRYIIVVILTVMPSLKYSQIFGHFYATGFAIDYLLLFKPYKDKASTVMEIINEFIVLSSIYPLLYFTNWVWEMERMLEAGKVIIGCIAGLITVNIIFFTVMLIKQCCKRCRLNYLRQQNIQKLKQKIELAEDLRIKKQ